MSEQKINYMAQLDAWTETNVLAPLLWTGEEEAESEDLSDETLQRVKHEIRAKALESYKNGIKAGFAKAHQGGRKEPKDAPAKTR